jgi:hypothetical protein
LASGGSVEVAGENREAKCLTCFGGFMSILKVCSGRLKFLNRFKHSYILNILAGSGCSPTRANLGIVDSAR